MLTVSQIKKLCFDLRISPSKKRGQNFLINEAPLHAVIKAAEITAQDIVVEIGPGFGVLTEKLLAVQPKHLYALEIEPQLAGYLSEKLSSSNFSIVNTDALQWLPAHHPQTPWKLVANIPYHITGAVIQTALELKNPPERMVLMMQKEVGEKLVAHPPHMTSQAVFVQSVTSVRVVAPVAKGNFWPAPEVDSVIVAFDAYPHKTPLTTHFSRVVKAGFSHPRKLLASNLSVNLELSRSFVDQKINECGLSPTVRAQELSVEQWNHLCTFLEFGIL